MKKTHAIVVAAIAGPVISLSGAAFASQNIAWTWNSGDHDAKANFVAYGEVYHGVGFQPDVYVDWSGPGASGRWNLGQSGKTQSLNFDWPEGKTVTLKVCQQHNAFPDDCSAKKTGVS
ncbi:hypothetical protein [Nocardioides acrostichi]|uniref:Uncharacterized protein n=1 Tax=Nocardioides acrostichi TaxID=2784339 RepID=A0A930UX02_9ACTN|nr:hypothetical protein [Nocardioides acrostichi]MBF4162423.1 hypothetical protein [Nocardioides acrostichi]